MLFIYLSFFFFESVYAAEFGCNAFVLQMKLYIVNVTNFFALYVNVMKGREHRREGREIAYQKCIHLDFDNGFVSYAWSSIHLLHFTLNSFANRAEYAERKIDAPEFVFTLQIHTISSWTVSLSACISVGVYYFQIAFKAHSKIDQISNSLDVITQNLCEHFYLCPIPPPPL